MADIDEIENALRKQVALQYGSDNATINSIRSDTEKALDLKPGYIKREFGSRSKEIINEELAKFDNASDDSEDKPIAPKNKRTTAAKPQKQQPKPMKAVAKISKDVKKDAEEEEEEEESSPRGAAHDDAEDTKADEDLPAAEKSESEMSVLIDEDLPPKSRKKDSKKKKRLSKDAKKSSKASPTKGTKRKNASGGAKTADSDDPKAAEVKKLQDQLKNCGVRKIWGIYLKPYSTSDAKITHLKSLLREVGMEGRYSQEKAKKIKKRREMMEELESITQGNILSTSGRSSRRNAPAESVPAGPRPAKRTKVIEDSDEEENDNNDNDDDDEDDDGDDKDASTGGSDDDDDGDSDN